MRALKVGVLYFAVVFGAGFVLGAVRQLLVVPRLGVRWAELLEMPLMLVVIVLAARWANRRLGSAPRAWSRLQAGLVALALLMAAELGLARHLSGLTPSEYLASRDPVSGPVYFAMLGLFGLAPLLLGSRRRSRPTFRRDAQGLR